MSNCLSYQIYVSVVFTASFYAVPKWSNLDLLVLTLVNCVMMAFVVTLNKKGRLNVPLILSLHRN